MVTDTRKEWGRVESRHGTTHYFVIIELLHSLARAEAIVKGEDSSCERALAATEDKSISCFACHSPVPDHSDSHWQQQKTTLAPRVVVVGPRAHPCPTNKFSIKFLHFLILILGRLVIYGPSSRETKLQRNSSPSAFCFLEFVLRAMISTRLAMTKKKNYS